MNHEERWMKVYDLAKKYYEEHGDLLIPIDYVITDEESNEIRLGVWIKNQRQAYRKSKINEEKIRLLEKIGMIWEVRFNDEGISLNWIKNYGLAKKYYEEHGDLLIPRSYVEIDDSGNEIRLGVWLNNQRQTYKKSKINEEKIRLLEKIGMIWEVRFNDEGISLNWIKNYGLAKKYYEEHGDLLIPIDYVVTDEESNEIRLGEWIKNQRQTYKKSKINEEKIKLLEKIGMIWEIKSNDDFISPKWLKNYELAKKYYEEQGDLLIPKDYVVTDDGGNEIRLGLWIQTQRQAYKKGKINEEKIKLLNKIDMVYEVSKYERWLKKYELAKKYYEEHGDLLIPSDYVTTDDKGIKINLGDWVNTQRRAYKGEKGRYINIKQIELLNEIDMVWNKEEYYKKRKDIGYIPPTWLNNYKLAKKYYKIHGDLLIPIDYVITDEESNEIRLGVWLNNQRQAYKKSKISEEKIRLLEKIGMIWEVKGNDDFISPKWLKNYELAKKYYEEQGDLLIPIDYVVTDEESNEIRLGVWLNTQRKAYNKGKINQENIKMLEEIGMIWFVKYYERITSYIEEQYLMYQYGLLDQRKVDELIESKIFEYKDKDKLVKGNAIVLSRKR